MFCQACPHTAAGLPLREHRWNISGPVEAGMADSVQRAGVTKTHVASVLLAAGVKTCKQLHHEHVIRSCDGRSLSKLPSPEQTSK